jgi:mono/diheme cytochrome c family protein
MSILIKPSVLALLLAGVSGANAQQADGAGVYKANCAMCHQDQGQGAAGLAPPLKGSYWDKLAKAHVYVPGVLLAGMHGPITTDEGPFTGVMPTQNRLSDGEIAAVSTFLVRELAGQRDAQPVEAAEVARLRAKPATVAELRTLRKQSLAK